VPDGLARAAAVGAVALLLERLEESAAREAGANERKAETDGEVPRARPDELPTPTVMRIGRRGGRTRGGPGPPISTATG